MIDEAKCAEIRAAIERARDKPIPWETVRDMRVDNVGVIKLEDRPPGQRPQSEHVEFGDGTHVAISFECQPAGLLRYVSVSSAEPRTLPSPATVKMIMHLFGVTLGNAVRVWFEEFAPGRHAINFLQIEQSASTRLDDDNGRPAHR